MAASQSTCSLAFQKVVRDFKATADLEPTELRIIFSTSLTDLQIELNQIQTRQKANRSTLYMRRLSPLLEALNQYREVLGLFLDPTEYISCILGSLKLVLKIAATSDQVFNSLLEAYRNIGDNLPRFAKYENRFYSNPYLQTILISVFEDLTRFHCDALGCFKVRTWEQLFPTRWNALATYIAFLNKDLRSCKLLLENEASLVEIEEFQGTREVLHEQFRNNREAELARRRTSVQQWLSFANSENRQEDAAGERHHGTGNWLLQHDQFKKWFDNDYCMEPLLWLSGKPGAGKTILASLVVEEIRCNLPQARVVFFYCRQSDGHRNGFIAVAKAILAQLFILDDGLLHYLYEKSSKSGEPVLSSMVMAKSLLEMALKTGHRSRNTYIVLDGLDEYSRNDRKDITSCFRSIIEGLSLEELGTIRCLFVSQDDGDAYKDLNNISHIKISHAENKSDIEAYCKFWHSKIDTKFGRFIESANIARSVTARAQGMFLFAKLVITNLYEQPTRRDLAEELRPDKFPSGLEQAYARILDRVLGSAVQPASKRDKARQLLGWLACAKRPLKWYEVQGAISIDLEDGSVNYEREFKETCKDLCASLVEINSDDTVVLVHLTAKQYLVDQGCIRVKEVETELALLCLSYLGFEPFTVDYHPDGILEMLCQGFYAFADYAGNEFRLDELIETLEVFLDTHWAPPKKACAVSKTNSELFLPLRQAACYEKAVQAVITAKNKLHSRAKSSSEDEVLTLTQAMQNIREVMERIATSGDSTQDAKELITRFHGLNWFKCGRINCQFYHQGFATEPQRRYHVSKHERSFTCTEEGCLYAIIGFVTNKGLQKHASEDHGIDIGKDVEFPDEESSDEREKTQTPVPSQKPRFSCHLCSKTFTRKNNLQTHYRTHTDERPFVCDVCGKAFARQGDCKRHQVLHDRKTYYCKGDLHTGGTWGCGQKFARVDEFGQHIRSQGGRKCISALQEEEIADIRREWREGSPEPRVQMKTVPFVPASLLQTYPELADLPWDSYDLPPLMALNPHLGGPPVSALRTTIYSPDTLITRNITSESESSGPQTGRAESARPRWPPSNLP